MVIDVSLLVVGHVYPPESTASGISTSVLLDWVVTTQARLLLKWATEGRQSRKAQRICKRRGACEPAVEDEETGAIPEDERSEDCSINYL